MKTLTFCLMIIFISASTHVYSQWFINVNIQASTGSSINISSGGNINIIYNIFGQPDQSGMCNPRFSFNIKYEIYDVANLLTPVYTTSTYFAQWSSSNNNPYTGSNGATFTIPCSVNLTNTTSYEIKAKITNVWIEDGDHGIWCSSTPGTTDNSVGSPFFGSGCSYNTSMSAPYLDCTFKIANATATTSLSTMVTTTDVTCNGGTDGSATVNIISGTGPFTFQWDAAAANQVGATGTSLAAGTYVVTITDGNGCELIDYVTITEPDPITPILTTTDVTCSGTDANGSASATVTGGVAPFTYSWTGVGHANSQPMIDELSVGNYVLTVTDANGCQATATAVINQDPSVLFVPYQTSITGNVTWNQPLISVDGQVFVEDGATLTIANGTRVEFSHRADQFDILPNGVARLIVRAGGNLIVEDFAILTGCGGGEWDGIRVLGTGILNTGQATATIGEATIENAYMGVANFDFPKINQGIVNNQGGQITATGTTFKNNRTGIFTRRNVNGVPYLVRNCNFIYDGNSLYSYTHLFEDQPTHISVNETTNFTAIANNYNGGVNDFPAAERGYGISCFDCEININNPIAGTQEFNGLTRAINSYHLGSNMITVNNVNINNCQEGIYLQGADLAEINNSKFNIATADAQDTYGVYLVGAGGTQVQGNNFIGGVSSTLDSYGLIAETTGSDGALVFDNTFEATDFGLQTQGDNPAFKIRCNNFGANGSSHNQYAWATLPLGATNTLMNQGSSCGTTPFPNVNENQAGNEWLDNCATGTTDVYVDDNISFAYKAHERVITTNIPTTQPTCSSPVWKAANLLVCTGVNKTPTSCNSPFAGITVNPDVDFDAYTTEVKILIGTYQNEVIVLTNLIDGGNTLALLSAINSQPVGNVKNTLLTASPYLSDEVLLAYLNKTPPAGHIKQVIEQNSPVTTVVTQKLDNMNLPTGIRNQINALQTGVSERQQLENQILSIEGEIQLLINDLRRRFRVRLEKPKEKQLLEDMARVETDKSLVKIYLDENNTVNSRTKLNQLAQHNTTENTKFCTLMNCLVTAKEQNRTVDELTTTELQTVETVAFSETKVANNAQVITNKNPNQFIEHSIVKINNGNNLRQLKLQENETLTVANFNLYPNPSAGLLTIQSLEKIEGNYSVEIVNAHGQRVITQKLTNDVINLSPFGNGIYLIRVLNNSGVEVYTSRIILQK